MESVKQELNASKDSDSESSVELKRKTPANNIAIVDYQLRDEDETYESSSDDFPSSSSSISSSSSVSSASSLEPVSHKTKKQNDKKKESWGEIKTKGEMSLDDLPRIEDLHLNVLEDELKFIGKISAIVDRLVVVQSEKGLPALDMDSVLFLKFDKPLGQVFDTFGPVSCPYYCVRFNSGDEIKQKGIKVGVDVFFAPADEEVTNYILYQEIKREKGSDASWKNNNEPPVECLDFSDDEAEINARQKKKGKRTLGNNVVNGSSAPVSQSVTSVLNRNTSLYRPAVAKEQHFTGPSPRWLGQNKMSSCVSSVTRPAMHNPVPNSQLAQPFRNAIRPQVNLMQMPPAMMHNTSPNFASNQVGSLCMVNVARPPPPLFTNVTSQPPHNVSTSFSGSLGNHNYITNQQCANIQPSFNNAAFSQVFCNSSMAQQATSPRQQSYGQSLPGVGTIMPGRRPVFAAPPVFNLFCLPPPPPPVPNIDKSAIPKPQVNFMRQQMPVTPPTTINQISTTNSSHTFSLTPSDNYGHAAMFNRYPMANHSPTVQPPFYMPFSAASVSRPNDFSASVSMFPTPAQFSSPPPTARCGISPYPSNVQPAASQVPRYPPSVVSQPSSFFLQ